MADVVETCSRCGKLIEGGPALVVVQSGPRAPAQPVINLCPACATRCHGGSPGATTPGSRSPRPIPSNDRPARRIAIAITTTISFASAAGGGGGEGG